MVRNLLTVASLVSLTTFALAQSDPIAARRDMMKSNGAATKTGGEMAKGEIPFDLAKAHAIFKNYAHAAEVFPTYFPDDSKTGGETTASPKIWEDKADFQARFDAWGKQVKAAEDSTRDLATFRVAFGDVTKACGSCHTVYRIKK